MHLFTHISNTKVDQLNAITPIIIAYWGSGEHLCFPNKTTFQGNLICAEEDSARSVSPNTHYESTGVMEAVLNLVTLPEQWVLGAYANSGKTDLQIIHTSPTMLCTCLFILCPYITYTLHISNVGAQTNRKIYICQSY